MAAPTNAANVKKALANSAQRHPNVAAVALANKNARIVWAMLARDK
jgi:hypothetical protein